MIFKYPLLTLLLLLLLACQSKAKKTAVPNSDEIPKKELQTVQIPELSDTIWIVAVGDVMPATDYDRVAIPPKKGRDLFLGLTNIIQEADLAFANFEGVLGKCKDCKARKCYDKKVCYRFRVPEIFADRIKEAGFDFLNLSTNHIEDFGPNARRHTDATLREKGFHTAGIEERPCCIFEQDGVRYGFCAFSQFKGCFKIRKLEEVEAMVKKMADSCDIVIVSLHGGAEGPKYRHQPKEEEVFLKFNRGNLYEAAHRCIDAGADLIIGTGPHVTRAVELYKDRLIMYSLGNFCTYGPFGKHEYTRHAPLMRIGICPEGQFIMGQAVPIKQIDKGMPRFDSTGLAIKHLQELTAEDFPNTPLKITSGGWLLRQ